MRVVVFSHGHPTFNKGGGEIAAWNLYRAIDAAPGHDAWFIARSERANMHLGAHVAMLGEREFLVSGQADCAELSATIPLDDDSDFVTLLRAIDPDVLHFHHYYLLGLETIRAARRACPRARIVLTLHDYMGICANMGQMLKTSGTLCHQASPRECAQCFPDRSPEDFFLRERYVRNHFALVDDFISPSRFLAGRYAEWGLPPDRLHVIENCLVGGVRPPSRAIAPGEGRSRFAYIGQINPFKGVDLVLEAFARLPRRVRERVTLDVYGAGLELQTAAYRSRVDALLAESGRTVQLHGAYDQREIGAILGAIDWVVMGSVWWENSPLVIQEAHQYGRPVICPDIGGMSEKVEEGVGGRKYRAADAASLASLVASVQADETGYEALCARLPTPAGSEACVRSHLSVYGPRS